MEIQRLFVRELLRRLDVPRLPTIQAVVGPRQVGKTTGIKQVLNTWKGHKIYESADGTDPLTSAWLHSVWQRAVYLGSGTLLVIDEIQKIPDWSESVKELYDTYRDKGLFIVILGSASFKIQKGLQDSLAGRYEVIKVPHWNFYEMRLACNFNFEQFLTFGGYPGAAFLIEDSYRWREYVKESIIENILTKDIISIAEIRNPALLRQVFYTAMEYPSQEVSFQKLVGQLQEKGAVATVKSYLEILQSAYLLKLLYKFSGSKISTRTSSPKLLPLTPALVSAVSGVVSLDNDTSWRGRVFETAVGGALVHIADEIYYWREGANEVDFVLKAQDLIIAVEVKSGRKKKTGGLAAFMKKFPKAIPLLLDWEKGVKLLGTEDYEELRRSPKLLLEL
jgi:uncharacterized protein